MAVIHNLDQHFIDTQLGCPAGKSRVEIVDPLRTGLYIEVRSGSPGQGTYYLRHKIGGKTRHKPLGRTTDMTLAQARTAAAAFKTSLTSAPMQLTVVPIPPATTSAAPKDAVPDSDTDLTLDAFMTDYYFPHVRVHKRSWKRDDQLYRLRIRARFGHLLLRQITRVAVNQFKLALMKEELSNASVNHHVQLMRHVFNLAISWGFLERNVLARIELLELNNEIENYLDDEQVDDFVEVSKTDSNRGVCLILMFLLSTGCRLSEALKAEWGQVDVVNRVWKIVATNSKSKKTKYLPLNDSAMWVVEQLNSKGRSSYLFPSPATGKPYTTITRAWYRIRKAAGIADNVRIHDLRHTFASRLVSRGTSLYEAQRLLGHADSRTTLRYAHLSMAAMKEASNVAAFAVT